VLSIRYTGSADLLYSNYITSLDPSLSGSGWIERNFVQLGYQLADCCAGFSWSFVLTCLILFVINFIPGLKLRVSPEEEELGIDDVQLGEFAYDYVEIQRVTTEIPSPEAISGVASSSKNSTHEKTPETV
jgi:ammonium transporter, Amt family